MIYVGQYGNYTSSIDDLTEEDIKSLVPVEEIPQPEPRYGFTPRLRANLETQEVYYDYEPITGIEQIQQAAVDAFTQELTEAEVL